MELQREWMYVQAALDPTKLKELNRKNKSLGLFRVIFLCLFLVQTEKAKFRRRNMTQEEKTKEIQKQIQQAAQQKVDSYGKSEFVQENGKLRIKYSK